MCKAFEIGNKMVSRLVQKKGKASHFCLTIRNQNIGINKRRFSLLGVVVLLVTKVLGLKGEVRKVSFLNTFTLESSLQSVKQLGPTIVI